MEPHKFILGILLFGFVMSAGIFIMFGAETSSSDEGLLEDYDVDIDQSQYTSLRSNIGSDLYNQTNGTLSQIEAGEYDSDAQVDTMIKESYRSGFRLTDTFTTVGKIFVQLQRVTGVPVFVLGFGLTALLVTVTWMIIYMIRGFQPR